MVALFQTPEGRNGFRSTHCFDPRGAINLNELLRSFSAREAQPEGAAFRFHAKLNVKEGAAESFSCGPLRHHGDGLRVRWELKLVAIGELSHCFSHGTKCWSELVEMSFAGLGIEGQTIASERALVIRTR